MSDCKKALIIFPTFFTKTYLEYFVWLLTLNISLVLNSAQPCTQEIGSTGSSPRLLTQDLQVCPLKATVFFQRACICSLNLNEKLTQEYSNAEEASFSSAYTNYNNGFQNFSLGYALVEPLVPCSELPLTIHMRKYRHSVNTIKLKNIKVLTMERLPFSTTSGDNYSGVMFDILKALQNKHNFSMDVVNFDGHGPSGRLSWHQATSKVMNEEADIGASSFSVTFTRSQMVDFTIAIHQEPTAILIPAPSAGDKITALIRPFESKVWGGLGLSIFFVAPAFYFLHIIGIRFLTKDKKTSFIKMIPEIFMFINASLVQESVVSPTKRTRFLTAIWLMMAFVLSHAYVGVLVSILAVPKLHNIVDSLEELVQKNSLKWTFREGTTHHNLFKHNDSTSLFKLIGDGAPDSELVATDVDGVRKVISGNYAFIKEKSYLEYALNQDFQSQGRCRLTLAKETFFTVGVAFIVPKNSPILPLLDYEISHMIATGLMEKWKQMNWPKDLRCVDAASYIISMQPRKRKLQVEDFKGVSLIWICGIICGLIALFMEHIHHFMVHMRKKPRVTPSALYECDSPTKETQTECTFADCIHDTRTG